MALIEIENVRKIYRVGDMEVRALNGVSLSIAEGEYLSIIGPSGSGKSTLMHLIGCLDTPTEGRVILDGVDVSRAGNARLSKVRNEKLGFVFQSFNLLPKLSVLENTELPLVYAGVSGRERRNRAVEALEAVGLADRKGHRPSQLSGGERQRAAVARALVTRPRLVLADEPTGNLDSRHAGQVFDLMLELNRELGTSLVIVTHDHRLAARMDRVLVLEDGILREGGG